MLAPGQQDLSAGGGSALVFDDASGAADTRRVFTFTHDVASGVQDARVLLGTQRLADVTGVVPDFILPPGMLAPRAGRVCYIVYPPQPDGVATGVRDCVAFGKFTGDVGPFGAPTPVTPDDRSLQRVDFRGSNADDWAGQLTPTPQSNAGAVVTMQTLCGDGQVSQGEQCDGDALGGATCASLGFASGTLSCDQCHLDASKCTACGNGAINGKEECDGTDFGGRTCASLGFTGGTLTCSATCRLSTRNCSPDFLVPGGGAAGPECLAEWRVTNPTARPAADGRAPVRQRCKDGDGGCDADPAAGTCSFTVAVCLAHADARVPACKPRAIESWTLRSGGADALVAAVAALGPSSTADGMVTFAPPLDATERCTAPVALSVPTRGHRPGALRLVARTVAAGGKPRDADALKLVCIP
jgi:hypothetical protein